MLRCDLLAWILVTKLAPTYYRKLNQLLTETARYCELSSWRKDFKKIWRKLEKTPITMPVNDAYRPNVEKWICTCPFFVTSRFLLCKHLIQSMHRVPPVFFLETQRYREPPFWRHKSLKLLEVADAEAALKPVEGGGEDDEDENEAHNNNEEDEEDEDDLTYELGHNGETFEEAMMAEIDLISEFVNGLKHQVQFRDQRMLNTLQREGAAFFRLAKACMEKERRMNSTRGAPVSMWEKSTSSAMFYRTRSPC